MQSYQDILFQVQAETEQVFFRVPDSYKSEFSHNGEAPFLDFLPWPIRVTSLMFADGTEQSTAGGGGGGSQTPWLSNINAAGYTLNNIPQILNRSGDVNIFARDGVSFSDIGNWIAIFNQGQNNFFGNVNIVDPGGASGYAFTINGVPIGGGSQTPWLSDIDAAGYSLNNLGDHIAGEGYFYLNADSAVTNLYLSTNAGSADTRAYGDFSHYLSTTNLPNVILSDGGVRINAGSSQDGLAINGTPTYAQIRLVPTYGFGTAVLIQNDGTNLTIRGAPSSNYFGPGTTTQLTIALPNGNAFFAGSVQATDFLVGGVSIVSRIAALEAAIGA